MFVSEIGEFTILRIPCRICKTVHVITLDAADWSAYNQGMLIQDAMPNVSKNSRELIISGTCGICFDNLFGDDS